MINQQTETLIDFAEVAKSLPRKPSGKPIHAKTVARWALHGIRGIRLESLCVGGRRVTSHEACRRFFDAITAVINEANSRTGPAPIVSAAVHEQLAAKGLI